MCDFHTLKNRDDKLIMKKRVTLIKITTITQTDKSPRVYENHLNRKFR